MRTYTTKNGLPSNRVTVLYRDAESTLWIGTESGLARLRAGNGGKIERFPAADLLASDVILSLTEDRDGDLWIGTDSSGLAVLRDRQFSAFSSRAEALDRPVWSVLAGRSNTAGSEKVWLGTDGNGVILIDDGVVSRPAFNKALSSQVILALAEDAQGNLLAGTPDGLNRIHGDSVQILTSSEGLAEDFVRSLYSDRDGSLWVGTRHGLTHLQSAGAVTYTQANGLASDFVGAVLRDGQGDLWVGTLNGLSRFHGNAVRTYSTSDGLSSNVITDLYLDKRGRIWIGTQDGGLDVFENEKFRRFAPDCGVPATIYGIAEDQLGNFWLAAKSGIARLQRSALDGYPGRGIIPVAGYGTADGLRVVACSSGHPAIAQTESGDIWFAMNRGAATISAAHAGSNVLPPAVVVESVLLDEHAYDPAALTRVPAAVTHVDFEYAGISLKAPQKVRYRYKLEGFDPDWVDAGAQRIAYYTNLPPADYQFEVTAQNGDGVWNRLATSVPFTMAPHAYQTWWFRLLLVAIAVLAVYAGYLLRVRQMQMQYNAVLRERNRIAREIHDTLAQGFIGVSVQLEVVARLLDSSLEAARAQLNEARTLVRRSIADARASIWELRSQEAGNEDFAARLSKMAKQLTASSGTRAQVDVHGVYRPLAAQVEDELFRICQEAVTNVVRHAQASNVRIDLIFDARKLRITIKDDGQGFAGTAASAGPDGHFGLKGMLERADRIHAELAVDSTLGTGTTITVEAPAK
jgi:signal transduction histidine kinase